MFKIPKYQLYLLQLENYELGRFLKLLFKKGLLPPEEPQRKKLVWTNKAILIFGVAEICVLSAAYIFARYLHGSVLENMAAAAVAFLGMVVIFQLFAFLFFCLAEILILPIDFLFKSWLIARARARAEKYPHIKIIGVAGSYGKTTMKEALKQVLSIKYKVLSPPESVNTPVGVSRWIMREFSPDLDVAIVEMGEHYRGDVEELCNIVKPDIAVVTGINEAHLERMKNVDTVVSTIFEVVSSAKPGALVVLNGDDLRVMGHYKEYVWPDHKIEKYSAKGGSAFGGQISYIKSQNFNQERLVWEAEVEGVGKIFINLLGEYALGMADAAVKIGKNLGLTGAEIKSGLEHIKPVEHRLQPLKSNNDVLIIDDSYNGNPDGAAEAIKVLARFENRRKIYITPGLVETGKATADIHRKIGRQLASVADVVILIRNSVSGWIEEGIKSAIGNRQPAIQIIWFDTATEAYAALKDILRPNDIILFQNDWGDQYL